MKKYAQLLLFMCLFQFGNSQNINTSLASDINTKFAPLEKNRIPNHILLDYGFDLIDVPQFDGVLRSTNYLSIARYNQIYNTLVSSATKLNIAGILSPQQEQNEWKTLQKQQNDLAKFNNRASVVLSGLLFRYSKINPNALRQNKIRVTNDQYDDKYINGVWQNPYDSKLTFAISAPLVLLSKSKVDVSLPTTLWHSNTSSSRIEINFGNNTGYKNLTNGSVASTTYTATGIYTWTYRVRLSNGQYKYCRQKVKVTHIDPTAQARNPACGTPETVAITATKAYQGVFGSATLQIAYGSNNCTLQNPLIVAEGLDTGLYAQAGSIGDSDYNSFRFSVLESQSIELQNLITNNTSEDYDIVYVNWDNGTDYIQRNAYVLEAVIAWVNQQKADAGSTAQNVVLGQSMGGLVARYALKDMENESENHDTSLYVSHDVPHQGAHVPLGILHMGRHIANEFLETPIGDYSVLVENGGGIGLGTINDLLDTPAINQMLIYNVDTNGNRTNTTHTAWQTELQTMGYPEQTRNIALSNGSHCASSQGLSSNQAFVSINGQGGTTLVSSLLEFIFVLGPYVGTILEDTPTFLLGYLPGNSELQIEFKANAFPSSGTARIYKGRLTYKKTFLWLFPITRTIFDESINSKPSDQFIDNYPGGVSPNALAVSESNYENHILYSYGYNLDVNLNFDFVPVTSALDVGSGAANLSHNDYFKQYNSANPPTGNKAIPFVNFTTSLNQNNNLNAEHISFQKRNGDWLAEELDADATIDYFDCTAFCSNAGISGNSRLCNSSTYSVTSEATWVNWWVSQGAGAVTTSTNGNQITLTLNNSAANTTVVLNASYGNTKCGYTTVSKTIISGRPSYPNTAMTGDDYVYPGQYKNYYAPPATGATSYHWYFDYGTTTSDDGSPSGAWEIKNGQGSRSIYVKIGNINSSVVVVCKASNSCGKAIKYLYVTVGSTGGGGGGSGGGDDCDELLRLSSNPLSSKHATHKIIWVEDPCDDDNGLRKAEENLKARKYTIEIFNMYREKVYSRTQNSPSFDLTRLKSGFYFAKYKTKLGNILTKKILVK